MTDRYWLELKVGSLVSLPAHLRRLPRPWVLVRSAARGALRPDVRDCDVMIHFIRLENYASVSGAEPQGKLRVIAAYSHDYMTNVS